MDEPGRIAIVTGGCSGIGLATTRKLQDTGFRVAVFDLDPDEARDVAGGPGFGVDVADEASVGRAVDAVLAAYGRVDVLVNNAGIGGGAAAGLCHETSVEAWDRVQAVNARGPFLCTRAVLPSMMANRYGQVVTIASVNSQVALPGRCAYTASKGAALMFTRSVAADYARHGVRANAICPGIVRTPLIEARLDAGAWDVEALVPLGRVAEPDELAHAVHLLASGQLDYMTGAAWVIDGGWSAI